MERKTTVEAPDGQHDLIITREFDLPVDLLFRAHVEPEIIEQWMGSKAIVFEPRKHGSWRLQKKDGDGNILFEANGVFHEFIPDQKITRTFEMDKAGLGAQLEFLEFEATSEDTSKLTMHIIYRSKAHRDQVLKMPFAQGVNMAHNQLQLIANKLK